MRDAGDRNMKGRALSKNPVISVLSAHHAHLTPLTPIEENLRPDTDSKQGRTRVYRIE